MRILRIIWDWPPPWTGLAPGPYELTVAQQKVGNTLTVFCGGWPFRHKEKVNGIKLYRLPSGLIPGINGSVFLSTAPLALLYYFIYKISHKIDIIHAHGHLSLFLSLYKKLFGWLDKTPYVVHFHHVSAERVQKIYEENEGKLPWWVRVEWWLHQLSDKLAVKEADKLIFVSESMQKGFETYYKAPREKSFVLGNGVNTSLFHPVGERHAFPLQWNNKKLILFVGSLSKRKNTDLIIRSLAQLGEEYAAVFVGTGDQEEVLKNLASELNVSDRVLFQGYIPNLELAPFFQSADIFVLPSKSEGFPKVVLEALACGVPVVASGFDPGLDFENMVFTLSDLSAEALTQTIKKVTDTNITIDVDFINKKYSWEAKAKELQSVYVSLTK